ncbi:hypothetical protein [Marinobacter salarius]|jgi:hypothetical protein|uniref:hypothetical protein n=1 Tax=Marinobacter salarius TaxID=1420917 RepID=UPI003212C0EE
MSDFIAGVALAIALLSAVYVRHSVKAAEHANQIAIHHERLKIYKALVSLVSALSARGVAIGKDDVWAFYEPATLSKFYFKPDLATALLKVFDDSVTLISKKAEWGDTSHGGEYDQELVKETHALHRATRDRARQLTKEVESELVINPS